MEPHGNWNIVIVGLWNKNIFSIPWISRKLFQNGEVRGDFPVLPGFPIRYSAQGVEIFPEDTKLTIQAADFRDETVRLVEEKATCILETLPETPVRAAGYNFTFLEREPRGIVSATFDSLGDTQVLLEQGIEPEQTIISRRAPYGTGVVNLFVTRTLDGVRIGVNFHRDVQTAGEAREFLLDRAVELKNRALELLRAVYDLALEEVQA